MTVDDCRDVANVPIGTGPVIQWAPAGSSWPQAVDVSLCVTDVGGRVGVTTLDGVTVS
jgi:hypothetical protein